MQQVWSKFDLLVLVCIMVSSPGPGLVRKALLLSVQIIVNMISTHDLTWACKWNEDIFSNISLKHQ